MKDLPKIKNLDSGNFFLIAGPCAIEGEEMALRIAEKIISITEKLKIPYIFKGSFKKANRTRIDSFTGIGDEKALRILEKVGRTFTIPTLTDIHQVSDAAFAANFVEVLQIPAFLVRQTDLVVAAAKTGKYVNLKKGQFMSPDSMKYAVQKVKDSGNKNVWITERGTMLGYQNLVVDFTGIPVMQNFAPTILDITHSLQKTNQNSGISGGAPPMISTLAKAGIAAGVQGIFLETHFAPQTAQSDAGSMLDLKKLAPLLEQLCRIQKAIQ